MKYSIAILSLFSIALAQTADQLVAIGFPACAVPCIIKGNQAAMDKHGCGLADAVCQCTTGYQTAQNAVLSCITSTNPCNDSDSRKIGTAGASLCSNVKKDDSSSTSASASKPSASASNTAGGAKPAAAPTSTKNAAAAERTFAAGAIGLAGAAAMIFAL